jgi:prepilin-type processing-associated H-X9-DG protein/prepilin-type N-terminal cleavage/methylation domain-containing protein
MNNRNSNLGKEEAFTLAELLVVISILGILAALSLAVLSSCKKKALRIECVNNVGELDNALLQLAEDNHVYPFLMNWGFGRMDDPYFATGPDWHSALQTILYPHNPKGSGGVWRCPSAQRPSDWPEHYGYENYGYNAWGLHRLRASSLGDGASSSLGLGGQYFPPPLIWTQDAVKEVQVVAPTAMIAVGDAFRGDDGVILDGVGLDRERPTPQLPGAHYYDLATSTRRSYARHQGKANIAFCDGHVETLALQALFKDTGDETLSRWNRDHQPHRDRLSN